MSAARVGYSRDLARLLVKSAGAPSPPIDVIAIANLKGLQIKEIEGADTRWSGAMYPSQRIIAVNASHHINRRRFTIAHELGHFVLGHSAQEFRDEIGFEESFESGVLSDDNKNGAMEREANEFASELLMPLALIKPDFQKCPVPKELARRYGVSEAAMFVSLLKHRIFR